MTQIPVDYKKAPWRPKYLFDETFILNSWLIFGEHTDGTVDITDAANDIFENVPRSIAEEIIAARDTFLEVVAKHFAMGGHT